jgi:hypothetical protein
MKNIGVLLFRNLRNNKVHNGPSQTLFGNNLFPCCARCIVDKAVLSQQKRKFGTKNGSSNDGTKLDEKIKAVAQDPSEEAKRLEEERKKIYSDPTIPQALKDFVRDLEEQHKELKEVLKPVMNTIGFKKYIKEREESVSQLHEQYVYNILII